MSDPYRGDVKLRRTSGIALVFGMVWAAVAACSAANDSGNPPAPDGGTGTPSWPGATGGIASSMPGNPGATSGGAQAAGGNPGTAPGPTATGGSDFASQTGGFTASGGDTGTAGAQEQDCLECHDPAWLAEQGIPGF
jgi:hypothetical protein